MIGDLIFIYAIHSSVAKGTHYLQGKEKHVHVHNVIEKINCF